MPSGPRHLGQLLCGDVILTPIATEKTSPLMQARSRRGTSKEIVLSSVSLVQGGLILH